MDRRLRYIIRWITAGSALAFSIVGFISIAAGSDAFYVPAILAAVAYGLFLLTEILIS